MFGFMAAMVALASIGLFGFMGDARPVTVRPRLSAEVGNPKAKEERGPLNFWTSGFV